jgi:hypothetical protein
LDQYVSPVGNSTAVTNEANVKTLSPHVSCTAQNLVVHLYSPADLSGTDFTFTLRANDSDTALICNIPIGPNAGTVTCNSAALTAAISADSEIDIEVSVSGAPGNQSRAYFGWECSP